MTTPRPSFQWTAVVWDLDNEAHPIGSFSFRTDEARNRQAAESLAQSRAVAQWPAKRLDVSVLWA